MDAAAEVLCTVHARRRLRGRSAFVWSRGNERHTLSPHIAPHMKTSAFRIVALAVAVAFAWTGLFPARAGEAVRASRGTITLPTYPWAAVKHPYFRGTDGVNIYPYPMLDFLSRDKTNRTYATVILENDYLRITFLPELGGKIHGVFDKSTGQQMFYVNNVIKPALIGQAGAWTSGGVEWNTGPQGHTVGCMQPVDVVILPPEPDGSQSVAIGETERIYGTKWTVVVTLRPGRSFLEERIRIYNPTETIRPYCFWNCTAAPNTKGFRFIYPMTLGTDHGAERFFHWPVHDGKDLSYGTNYQDASSIFAWYCDQDFFGSYNNDLARGVVAVANHHQLPGKKAWTWGWGGYGTMHQADLTDNDGPYNEVQTGPLLTQGEVGRLDPCEAVEWMEWWYPIHGIGGFTFANKDIAANVSHQHGQLELRLLGSGSWNGVEAVVRKDGQRLATARCDLTPQQPVELTLDVVGIQAPFEVELAAGGTVLARFRHPLDLPVRTSPEKKTAPQTASELAQSGWDHYLFARFAEAEAQFRKALEQDRHSVAAHTGLAFLKLDPDPAAAAQAAQAALAVDPDAGRARFALAVAEDRRGKTTAALDAAWLASRDPAVAVPSRALLARLLIRESRWEEAVSTLQAPGPWQSDPVCRNRLAVALQQQGRTAQATRLAEENLALDPLDAFAVNLVLAGPRTAGEQPAYDPTARPEALAGLLADLRQLSHPASSLRIGAWPLTGRARPALTPDWPSRFEDLWDLAPRASAQSPDPQALLLIGHLLFYLDRHGEAREAWKKAAELGAQPVIAYRALGMAAKTLDHDRAAARQWLEKANALDPQDSIVARDLARVLFELADQAGSDNQSALIRQAGDCLRGAFEEGKGRSDFVALLARSYSRLGDWAAAAKLLDSVRITIWEGAREAHDLFEEAHLALGDEHLKAGRPAEALAEFNRALEYPENLATGKLENAREAHIHYRRGNALAALGHQDEAVAAWRLAANEPPSRKPDLDAAREKAAAALREAGAAVSAP